MAELPSLTFYKVIILKGMLLKIYYGTGPIALFIWMVSFYKKRVQSELGLNWEG
jgi:hypothetical protein